MSESEANSSAAPQAKHDSSRETPSLNTLGATVREFFVDFLGSLVPGFFFISLSAPLLTWLLWLFRDSVILQSGSPLAVLPPLQLITSFRIELVSAVLVFAYVLGSVFFRQDPKIPDQESAAHVLANITDINEVGRLVIQPPADEWDQQKEALKKRAPGEKLFTLDQAKKWATSEGGQYPYSHLKQYLERRGLGHLAEYVTWNWEGGDSEEDKRRLKDIRSKMFINVLKVRLQYCVPEKCSEIVRNEAHIRMMSSVWYACKALQKLYWWTLVAALLPICVIVIETRSFRGLLPWSMQMVALALFSAVPAKLLRVRIKKFIHYQRVREIVFVLETAWFAQERGQKGILTRLPGEPDAKASGAAAGNV